MCENSKQNSSKKGVEGHPGQKFNSCNYFESRLGIKYSTVMEPSNTITEFYPSVINLLNI